jgi:hypothetical protein
VKVPNRPMPMIIINDSDEHEIEEDLSPARVELHDLAVEQPIL